MKRLITSMLIVLLLCVAFIGSFYKGYYSYATNQDGTLTNDELDVAMLSWLQSHGGNIFSPQNYRARKTYEAGLLHNFVYGAAGGYDAIRQHINGGVGGNNELRFDYDGFIIHQLNTWLNTELQNGSFGQGVSLNENGMFSDDTENTVFSNYFFTDACNNTGFVYTNYGGTWQKGTLLLTIDQLVNLAGGVGTTTNVLTIAPSPTSTGNVNITHNNDGTYTVKYSSNSQKFDPSTTDFIGLAFVYSGASYNPAEATRMNVRLIKDNPSNYLDGNVWLNYSYKKADSTTTKENIIFYTNINNNITNYPDISAEGTLYITPKVKIDGEYKPYTVNEGDTIQNVINNYYNDSNEKDKTISVPSDSPNGGSGGSGGSGGTPPNWNNPFPNLSPDGNGGFNFNFTLPDLNIDWNINGLSEKFPFSIPFDLIRFVSILNAEPETPHFEGTVNLIVYEWNIDADLSDFDNLAGIVRNVEFIGFCITLILITRRMIKG